MSRTLFLYILKDLLRIFLLTAGGLAGIMSFGGLLQPLTEHGLDAGQVAQILTYFMPAMMTYSLPIAALFATTVVYGRLAADNEITGMRAAGIAFHPFGGIGTPALVLGLTVAIISLLFLCFVVPVFTLKVERVIYANLAELVAGEIQRTRQIKFEDQTIYAREAAVAPVNPDRPDEQVVTLGGVMVVSYAVSDDETMQVPKEFYLAERATAVIWPDERNAGYLVQVHLEGGNTVPREYAGAYQGGLMSTSVGPFPIDSPIREGTEFMDVRRLHELYENPLASRRVQEVMTELVSLQQSIMFLRDVQTDLTSGPGRYRLDSDDVVYEIQRGSAPPRLERAELIVPGPVKLVEERDGRVVETTEAEEIRMTVRPVSNERMSVRLRVYNAFVDRGDEQFARGSYEEAPSIRMPEPIRQIAAQPPEAFINATHLPDDDRDALRRALVKLTNGIKGELYARASFAVSCLILVVVGCALGMMFRSGNFLNAFALSVAPALLCIALIQTGQHMTENIPRKGLADFANTQLDVGLALIWSGNIVVGVLALVLFLRLQRQ